MSNPNGSEASFRLGEPRLRFCAIDKLLVLTISISMLISLMRALPSALTRPGFSSFILFEDPSFLLPYLFSLFGIGFLWFRQGERRTVAALLVIMFSILTVNLWQMKAPDSISINQPILYGARDTITSAALTSSVLQSGHLVFTGYGSYPAVYLIGSVFGLLSGTSLLPVILSLNTLLSALMGLLSFLIIDFFSKSHKLSAAVAMMSIIADENLIKQPQFTPYEYGVAFFFLLIVLVVGMSSMRSNVVHNEVPFVVLFTASALTYSVTPFVVILVIAFSMISKRGRVLFSRMIGFVAVSYAAWSVYVSWNELGALANGLFSLIGASNPLGPAGAGRPLGYYLVHLLSANVAALPYRLGYLLPAWFVVYFGVGILAWIVLRLLRPHGNVPPAFIIAALLVTTVLLFLDAYPAGTGWDRMLLYFAPFIGATLLYALSNRRGIYVGLIVLIILVLTLPTVVAYSSDVGEISTYYPWQVGVGTYLINHMSGGTVYFGNSVVTLNYGFNSRMVLEFSTGGLTPAQESRFILEETDSFSHSGDGSVLVVSSLFTPTYVHLFGYTYLSNVTSAIGRTVIASNVVYSDGFLLVLGSFRAGGINNT